MESPIACVLVTVVQYYLGSLSDSTPNAWQIATWVMAFAVNVGCTSIIVARLWSLRPRTPVSPSEERNIYKGITFILLESGMIFTLASCVMIVLLVIPSSKQAAVAGINVVTQLAVCFHLINGLPLPANALDIGPFFLGNYRPRRS